MSIHSLSQIKFRFGKVKWKRPETLNLSQVASFAAFKDLVSKNKKILTVSSLSLYWSSALSL